ncbi:MAG: hypothetical protein ABSG99_08450 [Sedimentisphaerales bacterium]
MSIEEFVVKFIEQEEAVVRQVVFGFLGYAILAVSGLVYVLKECLKENVKLKWQPRWSRLLIGSFISAGLFCLLLGMKFDGRKNFCIEWLPAAKKAYPNIVTDKELIEKFCQDYHKFDLGQGLSKNIEDYQRKRDYIEPPIARIGFIQNEWLNWLLSIVFVFISVDCYVAAIQGICLNDPNVKPAIITLCKWVKGKLPKR